jgi:hypothetical protein
MNCGAEILVRDIYGANAYRFIAQCHDRYLLISHVGDWRNGYMLPNWQAVLRELVAMAVPGKITERVMDVQSAGSGTYHMFRLAYPLSAKAFADLLGVDADEVRAELADLAVEVGA